MDQLKQKIAHIFSKLQESINVVSTLRQLESLRLKYLGKKGEIPALFLKMRALNTDQKRTIGPLINNLKNDAEELIKRKQSDLVVQNAKQQEKKNNHFDVTAYTPNVTFGHLHPFTHCIEEIENIFMSMGFDVFDGPEVETEFYNFTALNIGPDHPARDMYDTLWLHEKKYLLRTHTSPVQIHAMQTRPLPLASISPGRVFRHEAVDASHDSMFLQCEGIMIDKNISMSDLFGTAQHFLQTLFNTTSLDIRIRPGFFPFVEPGFEIDMRCQFCSDGCSICKKTTWIEVFPGGLIHPNVLKAVDINPDEYSGFAFGFGLTRLAMLRYGISDIRLFHSGKLGFLEQF